MNAVVALLLAALLGGLAGSGTAEKAIEKGLRDTFHPQRVQVNLRRGHRSPFSRTMDRLEINLAGFRSQGDSGGLSLQGGHALMAAKVGRVVIKAADFEVGGLPVKEMELTLADLRYDLWRALWNRKLRLLGFDPKESELVLTFTAQGLQRFLAPRVTALQHLAITLHDGRVEVAGRAQASWLRIPVRLSGRLEPQGGAIYLRDPTLAVSMVPIPGFLTERILAQINPLVNLNQEVKGPLRLQMRFVLVRATGLTLRAGISPTKS